MSLLATSNSNQDNIKFLNKMQRYYQHKAGSNFVPKQKSISKNQISTKIPSAAIYKIQDVMDSFMKQMQQIVRQFDNMDHYNILQILRKHQFFSDVAILLQSDLHGRIQQLEKLLQQKQQKIQGIKKQIKSNSAVFLTKNASSSIRYNSNKDLPTNLYFHAKALSQDQFITFYNKICLSNRIKIQKIHDNSTNRHKQLLSSSEQDLFEKITQLKQYGKDHNNEQNIKQLIEKLEDINFGKAKQCRRPCCVDQGEDHDMRLNKAKTLIYSTHKKDSHGHDYYKNDKSQEYFTRYYKGNSFNLHGITSVSKTKREQMEKLEDLYRKNLKIRHKNNNHRYSASYALN